MKFTAKAALSSLLLVSSLFATQAHADITLTITENTTLGGTNWAFSKGSGTIQNASPDVLVGQVTGGKGYQNSTGADFSLTVLSGTNTLQLQYLFMLDYGSLPGTNGNIGQGIDFQGAGTWGGQSLSVLNGLVFNADSISYSSFNPGTYVLPSYYSGYGTDFGAFTLQVGEAANAVPEPASLAILGLGLAGLTAARRKRKA